MWDELPSLVDLKTSMKVEEEEMGSIFLVGHLSKKGMVERTLKWPRLQREQELLLPLTGKDSYLLEIKERFTKDYIISDTVRYCKISNM